jgi:hypothetical protein
MTLKKIHSLIRGTSNEAIQKGSEEEERKIRRLEGRDVVHEVLRARARQKNEDLQGLVNKGTSSLRREKFKSCVKKQVFEIVSENFDLKNGMADEVTEEITEQIVNAADADPAYQTMFDQKKEDN